MEVARHACVLQSTRQIMDCESLERFLRAGRVDRFSEIEDELVSMNGSSTRRGGEGGDEDG